MTLRSRIPRGLFSFHFWRLLAFVAILLLGLALAAFAFWRGPEVSTVSAITGNFWTSPGPMSARACGKRLSACSAWPWDSLPHITIRDERREPPRQPVENLYQAVAFSGLRTPVTRPGIKNP